MKKKQKKKAKFDFRQLKVVKIVAAILAVVTVAAFSVSLFKPSSVGGGGGSGSGGSSSGGSSTDAPGTSLNNPIFANSIEECVDTSRYYVLPDGYIYAYVAVTESVPVIEANYADPSNSEWLKDHRNNSTGTIPFEGFTVTNIITVPPSGIVRVKGIDLESSLGSQKPTQQLHATRGTVNSNAFITTLTWYLGEENGVYTFINEKSDKTVYMRFCGTVIDGDENVIITVNEEIRETVKTFYEWKNTGLVYAEDDHTEVLQSFEERLSLLEGETVQIPSFWEDDVNECIAKIKALQVGKNCVTFPFFSDNHTRDGKTQYMGELIAYVMEECGMPYCFYGGDLITNGYAQTDDPDAEFKAQAEAFADVMSCIPDGRFCMALGNHENYLLANPNIEGSTTARYDRSQIYEIFLRGDGAAQYKHFGDDGTYYYVDDIVSKVRWVVLNTNGIGDSNLDSTQLSWFENTALSFNESGWGVVIISHIPITNHYEQSNITNADAVISILQNYINGTSDNKADIIGWYSGHIHRDRIYTGVSVNDTDDSIGEALGFTQVTITSDHTAIAYPVGGSLTTHPIDNSNKSHAIDFVTINKDTRTVNITRLGIGEDRSYTY